MDTPASAADWLARRQRHAAPLPDRQRWLAWPLGPLIVAQAALLSWVLDRIVFAGAGAGEVAPAIAALLPVLAIRAVLAHHIDRLAGDSARRVRQAVRTALYDRLRTAGPAALGARPGGEAAAVLTDAVEGIGPWFSRFLPARQQLRIVPPVLLLAVFAVDWLSGLVLLLTAPLVPLFMALIGRAAQRASRRQWTRLQRMGGHFLEALRQLPLLRAFGAAEAEAERIGRSAEAYRRETMQVLRLAFLSSAVLEFLAAISIALVAVFVGFRLLDGAMDYRSGLFVLLLAPEFYLPLRRYGAAHHARMEAEAAAERVRGLLHRAPQDTSAPSAPTLPRRAPIRIEAVRHTPPGRAAPALDGVTLHIEPGECLTLTGPSGAGKSTLLRLIAGFVRPEAGRVRIGDVALDARTLPAWRERLGWLPQRPHLFPGTLRENILLGCARLPESRLRQAVRDAGLQAFVDTLPAGLDTRVGEGGRGLSGGQRQRVALARALVRDPEWLLLDEPAAHLDPEGARAFGATLAALRGRVGIVQIAHRPESLALFSRRITLRAGRIAADTGPLAPEDET